MPGIFLYVALVDMLPELTSAHSHPSSVDEKQDKKVEAGGVKNIIYTAIKILNIFSGAALGVPAAAGDRHGLRGPHHARHRPLRTRPQGDLRVISIGKQITKASCESV